MYAKNNIKESFFIVSSMMAIFSCIAMGGAIGSDCDSAEIASCTVIAALIGAILGNVWANDSIEARVTVVETIAHDSNQ